MVNRILGPVLVGTMALAPVVSQAQETVRGLVCTVSQKCDLEKSHVTYDFTPAHDGAMFDTPASLNVNLHCVSEDGLRSSGSQLLESDDSAWGYGEISRLRDQQLIPYELSYKSDDTAWYNKLREKDFDCEMGNIEVAE